MANKNFESLYRERTLIKELMALDYNRYSYLLNRSNEIKIIINSEYTPIPNYAAVIAFYDVKLASDITKKATENLADLVADYVN